MSALQGICLACIGPSAARALEALGLRADVVASEHTLAGLVRALVAYYGRGAGGG